MCSSACLKQHLHIKQSTYRLQLSAAITEGLSARDLHYMQITGFCKHFFLLHVIISGLPIQQFFWSSQSVSEAYLISWYWLQTTDSFTDSFCDSYNNSHSSYMSQHNNLLDLTYLKEKLLFNLISTLTWRPLRDPNGSFWDTTFAGQ